MKVDFSIVLKDLEDKPIMNGTEEYTLGGAACTALLTPYQGDDSLDAKVKVHRYKLAQKASDGGEQELSAEDVVELKKLIAKFPPLIVGRCFEILDPSEVA